MLEKYNYTECKNNDNGITWGVHLRQSIIIII